jgi:hypothetical protein
MGDESEARRASERGGAGLVRLGGAGVLVSIFVHAVVNWALKEFPSPSLSEAQLDAYMTDQLDTWAIVHGARAVAVVGMVLFAAGLFERTSCRSDAARGWGVVGLLGTAMLATNLMITNGLETLGYLGIDLLRQNQELFWLLRNVTRTLFTTELTSWVLVFVGFSVAGWLSRSMPRWLVLLGCASAVGAMVSVVFIVDTLGSGWTAAVAPVTGFAGMIWFGSLGVLMLIQGRK